jgi:hypothetical protein
MKDNKYMLNTLLTVVLGLIMLIIVVGRTLFPLMIQPEADIPNLVLISLIALVLDHYLAPGAKRCYICIPVFSAMTFGLLPWAAAFVNGMQALTLALAGGITFTATTWLFTSIQDRLSSGPQSKAAPFLSALGLYLAAQCLAGIFL